MKTIVIWDTCGENQIMFGVIDRDISHLNQVYIGEAADNEALQDELQDLNLNTSPEFPYEVAIPGEYKVITCGYFP